MSSDAIATCAAPRVSSETKGSASSFLPSVSSAGMLVTSAMPAVHSTISRPAIAAWTVS